MIGPAALGIARWRSCWRFPAPAGAQSYDCRGYPPSDVTASLKAQVEAMRKIEVEAADRMRGLDTRPYALAAGAGARRREGDRRAGAAEGRGRAVRAVPQRRQAGAPRLRGSGGGAGRGPHRTRRPARCARNPGTVYVQTMPLCERWLGLPPQQSGLRADGVSANCCNSGSVRCRHATSISSAACRSPTPRPCSRR